MQKGHGNIIHALNIFYQFQKLTQLRFQVSYPLGNPVF